MSLAGIALFTFLCYLPTFQNQITNWDDQGYLESPLLKHLDGTTVSKMFYTGTSKELFSMGNYHPLTMLSLNLNYQMLSEDAFDKEGTVINPFVFQATNVVLHVVNTALVFFVVQLLFGSFAVSLITSLLFGVHPMHVESVTWISERKDVLYMAFFLSSLIFYLKYINKKNLKYFILAFCFFLLSALSKGQAVSLAITLVAVDYLKGRKLLDFKLIAEKALFIAAGCVFGIIAITAQQEGRALYSGLDGLIRVMVASWGFLQYFLKLIFPVNLSAFYPYPASRMIPLHYASGLVLIGLIIFACIYFYKRSKGITFALAFYSINIILLLQLIPVGNALMADRYVYVSSVGFFLLIGLLYQKLAAKKQIVKNILIGILAAVAIFWGYLTFERTQIWKDSLTLWNDTLEKEPGASVAWSCRAAAYDALAEKSLKENNYKKYAEYKLQVVADYSKSIELNYFPGYFLRGTAKLAYGEALNDRSYILSAINDFDTAVKIDIDYSRSSPNRTFKYKFFEVLEKRAAAFEALGDFEKALSDYNRAIEAAPENFDLYVKRGVVKVGAGDFKAAIIDFDRAVKNLPQNASVYANRALANDKLGSWQQALEDYDRALSIDNRNYSSYFSRAVVKYKLHKISGAIDDLSVVLQHEPENIQALNTRGIYYLDLQSIENACTDFSAAARLNDDTAKLHLQKHCSSTIRRKADGLISP